MEVEILLQPFVVDEVTSKKVNTLFGKAPSVADVLLYLPTTYESLEQVTTLRNVPIGSSIEVEVLIIKHVDGGRYRRLGWGSKNSSRIYQIFAQTNSGEPICLLFFKIFPSQIIKFSIGTRHKIEGRLEESGGQFRIVHPKIIENSIFNGVVLKTRVTTSSIAIDECCIIDKKGVKSSELNLKPVYAVLKGVEQSDVRGWVERCITIVDPIREKDEEFAIVLAAIKLLHNPVDVSFAKIKEARLLLAKWEVMSLQTAIKLARDMVMVEKKEPITSNGKLIKELKQRLPFVLTEDQEAVLKDIFIDQSREERMFRLIQGDVGSGKTAVALIAMLNAVDAGKRAVLMAPTTILAIQHYRVISNLLFGLNVNVSLLIGKTTAKERKRIIADLEIGNLDIIIGTHALVEEKNAIKNFHLCVVDEQHRFGVNHRSRLFSQNPKADVLMMTATPIPRTMQMMTIGDIDVSYIRKRPDCRLPIDTRVMSISKLTELMSSIGKKIAEGAKIYWVCPLIDGGVDEEGIPIIEDASVNVRAKELEKFVNKDSILVVHGKMKDSQKDEVMLNFINNSKGCILVATTVIEVGVDVPGATIMVIEEADRFGLSQLHQLRGRVGRGSEKSFCFLLYSKNAGELPVSRLAIMRESNDGFFISEQDLKLRGGGDLIGTKQSGAFGQNLKITNQCESLDLFKTVCEEGLKCSSRAILALFDLLINSSTVLKK